MNEHEYLTVADALELVLRSVSPMPSETVPLLEALGRVLAQPVVARDSLPPFANSSMDGYALRAEDVQNASQAAPVQLRVAADIAAGSVPASADSLIARRSTWVEPQGTQISTLGLGRINRDSCTLWMKY